jgi:uncharacterized protein (DUF1800 family)
VFCPILLAPSLLANHKQPKKIKAADNPPQYASFANALSQADRYNHALDRLMFGARPGDLETIQQIGLKKWLELQLHPERVPENALLEQRLQPLASLRMSIHDAYTEYPSRRMIAAAVREQPAAKLSEMLTPEQMSILNDGTRQEKRALLETVPPDKRTDFVRALAPAQRQAFFAVAPVELRRELMLSINPQNVIAMDLTEGKLLRAIYSTHQLEELLVDFWSNHFNVFINKGSDRFTIPTYEREAIRPHVFGKFYDLLLATAKSPAMLFYLDNWQSQGNQRGKRGLNENYGRELMELHTLGVDGGYTQEDVINVARCFTGWTIAGPRKGGDFEYNDRMHDKGEKVVLGHIIRARGGMNDGLEVLNILAHQPATARFISLQLAKRFVADDPPPSLVNRMAATFLSTDGDLREVTRVMITSPEFWSQGAYRAKVKTPFEMVVSAVRESNAEVTSAFVLAQELNKLGEPLYRKMEPTGSSNANAEWVSSAGLLERMNFAVALAHNRIAGIKVDAEQPDPAQLALSLGSPAFQRR